MLVPVDDTQMMTQQAVASNPDFLISGDRRAVVDERMSPYPRREAGIFVQQVLAKTEGTARLFRIESACLAVAMLLSCAARQNEIRKFSTLLRSD